MKKVRSFLFLLTLGISLVTVSCKKDGDGKSISEREPEDLIKIDSTQVNAFFEKHPDFKIYQADIKALYKKHDNHYIWYDKDGRLDFASVLYNQVNQIKAEGVETQIPYKQEIIDLFASDSDKKNPDLTDELLISSMYFYYAKSVYEGVDAKKSKETGWYLPREKTSYVDYLDNLMKDPDLIKGDKSENISQYYSLKKGLQKYREIQKKGGWGTIALAEGVKSLKVGDDSPAVAQIRKRLLATGDLKSDSGATVFDDELLAGINNYQKRQNQEQTKTISASLVSELNVSVEDRIKTIIVNMERCRWISPDIAEAKELIAVNIPSYRLRYIVDGKEKLTSNVVVGKELNKTVVFSGQMSYLVFSPYWNIPKSIIAKEIKPGMAKDKNYLEKHNMEWNDGNVRQKPGDKNSLGLVKFMFPNSNNIYLHDSPAKSLFNKEDRAFSHGCVRVQKAKELAYAILEGDKNWNQSKIDAAMHAGTEKNYSLKRKIPVYIAYFTAWADENGNVSFYQDIYKRDARLSSLLYQEAK